MNYNALNSELELAAPLSLYQRFLAVAGGFNSANRSSASVKRHDGDARSTFEIIGDLMGYSVALQNDLQFHSKRLKQAYKKKRNVYLLCFALLWLPFVLATIKLLDFIVTLLAAFKSIHMEQWSGITRLALFILVFVITFCITFFLSWVLKKLLGQKGDKLKPGLFGLIVASMAIYVIYMFVEVAQPFTTSLGMEPWSPLAITVGIVRSILIIGVFYLYFFVPVAIAMRIADSIAFRHCIDTLCVAGTMMIIIDLSFDDLLSYPDKKIQFINRLDYLAKITGLLSHSFTSDDKSTQAWIQEHFRQIASYVRERTKWVAAPCETTLNALREDFYNLSLIYISGNYGSFNYTLVKKRKGEPQEKEQRWIDRLRLGAQFVLGVVLPIALFLIMPQLQPAELGLEPAIARLLLVAWILLFIDAKLKLGIVAGLTGLAKGIRDIK